MKRESIGIRVSAVGIAANILLFATKLVLGILSGTVSLVADATNNLSDAGSSLISMISFRIAAKPADRDHPFGHARIEYVSSMIVSFLVMLIAVSLLKTSIEKMISPTDPKIDPVTLVVMLVVLAAKAALGVFYRIMGKKIHSGVIMAAATDSFSDCISTGAVLVSMLVFYTWGINCDAYVGAAVSVLIFVAGVKILNEAKNMILGEAPDSELCSSIEKIVKEYPEVLGIHDMLIHSYGHGRWFASFHAEVDGAVDVFYTHDVIDNIEKRIRDELSVVCTVHMDPIVTDDEKVSLMRQKVVSIVKTFDERMDIHDFRYVYGVTHSNLIFDISVPFEMKMSDEDIKKKVSRLVSTLDESFFAVIDIDRC